MLATCNTPTYRHKSMQSIAWYYITLWSNEIYHCDTFLLLAKCLHVKLRLYMNNIQDLYQLWIMFNYQHPAEILSIWHEVLFNQSFKQSLKMKH